MDKLKVAIIGYGGIARKHNTSYHTLVGLDVPVELVAVCDKNAERLTARLDFNLGGSETPLPEGIHIYSDVDDLLANEDFDVADICLPTFLHKDFVIKCLLAGKHVLCEKPMALTLADCKEMIAAEKKSGKSLMIAHVVRFSQAYRYLKEHVEKGTFGKLVELRLNRYSVYPSWGVGDYFNNVNKCGGVALDTHIHDIDFVQTMLGEPRSVSALEHTNIPYIQSVNSRLYYDDAVVIANCAWDVTFDVPFKANYRARFENATIFYDDDELKVYPYGEQAFAPAIAHTDACTDQIRYFIETLLYAEKRNDACTPESTAKGVKIIEAIRKSSALGGECVTL